MATSDRVHIALDLIRRKLEGILVMRRAIKSEVEVV